MIQNIERLVVNIISKCTSLTSIKFTCDYIILFRDNFKIIEIQQMSHEKIIFKYWWSNLVLHF